MKPSTGVVGLLTVMTIIGGVATASPAAASTTVSVKMTFAETAHPDYITGCPVFPDGFCGSGEVIPFGQATEMIAFGAGCGGICDIRTIALAQGMLTMEETSSGNCLGSCHTYPVEGVFGSLTDTVVGGTGLFQDATGELTGTVHGAVSNIRPAGASGVQLSGTIHYDP